MSTDPSWKDTCQAQLQLGLFDQRNDAENEDAIALLSRGDGTPTHRQIGKAFVMKIRDYVAKTKIIGAFEASEDNDIDILSSVDTLKPGTIVVIKGIPNASLLYRLGNKLKLDIRLFLETYEIPNSFRIQALPSRPRKAVTVKFISLGTYASRFQLPERRLEQDEKLAKKMEDHYKECLRQERAGIERWRAINLHDPNMFTVEQHATFLTYGKFKDSWSGILLDDFGRASASPSWILENNHPVEARFYPTSPSGRCSTSQITNKKEGLNAYHDLRYRQIFSQPNPFLSRSYTDEAMSQRDQNLCEKEVMVFLSDLFDTSALSWAQVLSYLRASHTNLPREATKKAPRLHADKQLFDRAARYFSETISLLESPPNNWKVSERGMEIATTLIRDFESLRSEADDLSNQCKESISMAMSEISITESQKSLATARRVQSVTHLAFLFIPLSFVASCFGMNIRELAEEGSSLRIYFAFAIPCTIVTIAVAAFMQKMGDELTRRIRSFLSLETWSIWLGGIQLRQ